MKCSTRNSLQIVQEFADIITMLDVNAKKHTITICASVKATWGL